VARNGRRLTTSRLSGKQMAGVTAIISGVAIYANGFGVTAWKSAGGPVTYTTAKNLVAAVMLIGLAALTQRGRPTRRLPATGLVVVAVIGGSVPFVLFFEGLTRAASSQAALIHKSLLIWVAVLAVLFLKEKIRPAHVGALALLVAGQLWLSGGAAELSFGSGEWMILAATGLWSIEVIVDKRLLKQVRPADLAVARMGGGALLLVVYGLATGAAVPWATVTAVQWGWIALTGTTLAAYVGTWLVALSRAPAIDVTAILVFGAVITIVLSQGAAVVAPAVLPGLVLIGAGTGWLLLREPTRSM